MSTVAKLFTGRKLQLILMVLIGLSFVLPQQASFWITPAYAQVKKSKKQKNVFNLLFGKRGSLKKKYRRTKAKRIKLKRKKKKKYKNKKKRRVRKSRPAVVVSRKNSDAFKIIVAGDFMAGDLAWGMVHTYADNPAVTVVDLSKALSGFARIDVKNWPDEIARHIDKIKPAAVVFLGGMNDRKQISVRGSKHDKLSNTWLEIYNTRIKNLAQAVMGKNTPLIWVGLPPVKSSGVSADYLAFNEIYRLHTESANGFFVNVWDGFANEEGQYVSAGPDINGQIKRLRRSDGINMNRTGKLKLAFYVTKAVRKLTGIGTDTLGASLPGIEMSRILSPKYNPAKTGRTIVYSLASPGLDGGGQLADHWRNAKEKQKKAVIVHELVNDGIMPKTHIGRIDHYGVIANEAQWFLTESPPDIVDQNAQIEIDTQKQVKSIAPNP
ncbi:MAG: DUF459 domain-containing protein [Hyphomicrobiales bacterium]|nr:DUF459 domain-containing protein [Hyphomicrobiales bacterium]